VKWKKKRGKGAKKQSTPKDHEVRRLMADLRKFWKRVRKGEIPERLGLLQEYSGRKYRTQVNSAVERENFAGQCVWVFKKPCFTCSGTVKHRHHIVQLQHGGINVPRNIVGLCERCHAEIHDWLVPRGVQTETHHLANLHWRGV